MTVLFTDDLVRIVNAGGGLDIDAGARMTDDLVRIANAASRSGATVILRNLGARMANDLVRIGNASGGRVILVLD